MDVSKQAIEKLISFERDANTLLIGPTSSGKTTLLKDILNNAIFYNDVSAITPSNIYVLLPPETKADWEEINNTSVTIINGKQSIINFLEHAADIPNDSVVIFDDLMNLLDDRTTKKLIDTFFFVTTHHRHLWTFFVAHDLFHKNLSTIRRNTQNFLLFDLLSSDFRSAQEFCYRLLGLTGGSLFLEAWKYCAKESSKGWIRLDQKLHRDYPLKTVITTSGISFDSVEFLCKSQEINSPLSVNINVIDEPKYHIPESQLRRHNGGSKTTVVAANNRPSNVQ